MCHVPNTGSRGKLNGLGCILKEVAIYSNDNLWQASNVLQTAPEIDFDKLVLNKSRTEIYIKIKYLFKYYKI